jgi:hypothetical protein
MEYLGVVFSSVSDHCDLSGGNLGRERRSGHDNRGAWPSDGRFGLSKRGSRGWSGSSSLLVMFNTKPGVASRLHTGDLGRNLIVRNDHTVPEFFGDENPIVATASLFARILPERDIRAKHEIYFRLVAGVWSVTLASAVVPSRGGRFLVWLLADLLLQLVKGK